VSDYISLLVTAQEEIERLKKENEKLKSITSKTSSTTINDIAVGSGGAPSMKEYCKKGGE